MMRLDETTALLDPSQWAFVGMGIVLVVFAFGCLVGFKL
jgi:hypothetical protein